MGPPSQSAHDRYLMVPTVLENPTFSKSIMLPNCQNCVSAEPCSCSERLLPRTDSGKSSYTEAVNECVDAAEANENDLGSVAVYEGCCAFLDDQAFAVVNGAQNVCGVFVGVDYLGKRV